MMAMVELPSTFETAAAGSFLRFWTRLQVRRPRQIHGTPVSSPLTMKRRLAAASAARRRTHLVGPLAAGSPVCGLSTISSARRRESDPVDCGRPFTSTHKHLRVHHH